MTDEFRTKLLKILDVADEVLIFAKEAVDHMHDALTYPPDKR